MRKDCEPESVVEMKPGIKGACVLTLTLPFTPRPLNGRTNGERTAGRLGVEGHNTYYGGYATPSTGSLDTMLSDSSCNPLFVRRVPDD